MFAGGRRRSSNNVRAMQLFYELKQQFPTIPDHVVSSCIASNSQKSKDHILREILEAAETFHHELMGRTSDESTESVLSPTLPASDKEVNVTTSSNDLFESKNAQKNYKTINPPQELNESNHQSERLQFDMNQSDANRNEGNKSEDVESKKILKRPDTLPLNSDLGNSSGCKIKQSDKCKDVHKLLNSEKPPRSPITSKRLGLKNSTNRKLTERRSLENLSVDNKTETSDHEGSENKLVTVETPTQTTDTLFSPSSVNVSLNVNCSMEISKPKCSTALRVVPQQPWCNVLTSPRSYTSVNLTLRPPSSEPQPPIDITSQNSSLTYSTSSFDSQKGLQSKLQITVSPTGGSVSAVRRRPRSYHPEEETEIEYQRRNASLEDLSTSPTLMKQKQRIEKLRIELNLEKRRLVAMQTEVSKLENSPSMSRIDPVDKELEKQLTKEIRHLRGQCELLTIEIDRETKTAVPLGETSEEFYRNIYTGQRGPIDFGQPIENRMLNNIRIHSGTENFNQKWSCSMCTFQNHPLLDKCEQCDMARIVHGTNNLSNTHDANIARNGLLNVCKEINLTQIENAASELYNYIVNDVPKDIATK